MSFVARRPRLPPLSPVSSFHQRTTDAIHFHDSVYSIVAIYCACGMLIVCVLNSQFSFVCLMFCVFWFKTCFSVSYLHLLESGIFPVFMYPTSAPYIAILEYIILSRSSIVFARRSTARMIITGLQGTTIRSIIPPHVAGMYHPMYCTTLP